MKLALILLSMFLLLGRIWAQGEAVARAYSAVNVRSGPGTQYAIIGQLTSGDEVPITGRNNEDSDWLRIDFNGREGWVAYFTVTVLGDVNRLELVAPLGEVLAPAGATPVTTTPVHALTDVFVTAYRTVNVRSGPGTNYVRIGNLEPGSSADVTGRTNDNEWLRINYTGEEGWVAFFVVSLTGSLDDIDVARASPLAETEDAPRTVEITTRYNVNLHESPALDSQITAIVPFNTDLQAQARSDSKGSWLQVEYDDQTGWLLRALVNAHAGLDRLSIRQR